VKSSLQRLLYAATLVAAILDPAIARAEAPASGPCAPGVLPHGALSLICVPPNWNGALVVYAHGYVSSGEPLGFYHLTTPDGTTSVPALAMALGYAFATTSYRKNGLAILEGVEDMQELIQAFSFAHGVPAKTYVAGVSEGGLVAALLSERSPGMLTSTLAMCGPIGSFQGQLDHFEDFRVLFDYFFPAVFPGNAVSVPPITMDYWNTVLVPNILAAVAAKPAAALELVRVAHAAIDIADPTTVGQTIVGLLWYSAFATTDAQTALGGNPYDNRFRWYFGSSDDLRLNLHVQRFAASPAARFAVRNYETNGHLRIPMVTLHTTGDPITPVWHELLYFLKADTFARTEFIPLPIARYGHCNFTTAELLFAFSAIR